MVLDDDPLLWMDSLDLISFFFSQFICIFFVFPFKKKLFSPIVQSENVYFFKTQIQIKKTLVKFHCKRQIIEKRHARFSRAVRDFNNYFVIYVSPS